MTDERRHRQLNPDFSSLIPQIFGTVHFKEIKMAAAPPHALEVTPESALQFVLTRDGEDASGDGSSKCTMTLRHTGQTTESIAFKVRVFQHDESKTQSPSWLIISLGGLFASAVDL